jgi:nitrile hydratase
MNAQAPIKTRFAVGDRVAVASRLALGHCRTPWYLRGRRGFVADVQGIYHDPERLAYHKPGLPLAVLYKIRFLQRDLWPGYKGAPDDHLEADIYEYWLERAP